MRRFCARLPSKTMKDAGCVMNSQRDGSRSGCIGMMSGHQALHGKLRPTRRRMQCVGCARGSSASALEPRVPLRAPAPAGIADVRELHPRLCKDATPDHASLGSSGLHFDGRPGGAMTSEQEAPQCIDARFAAAVWAAQSGSADADARHAPQQVDRLAAVAWPVEFSSPTSIAPCASVRVAVDVGRSA